MPQQPAQPATLSPAGRAWAWAAVALAWLAGVAVQLQQAALWPLDQLAGVAAVSVFSAAAMAASAWWLDRRWGRAGLAGVAVLAALALAFTSTAWRAHERLAQRLNPALEGRDVVATGTVVELPKTSLVGTRFVFEPETATLEGQPVQLPPRLSLGWFRGFDGDGFLAGPATELRAGQRWRLTLRLRQPHGLANPGGFDLELWLFSQGLGATGSVRAVPGAVVQRLAPPSGWAAWRPGLVIERARQAVRDAITAQVPDARAAGVLAALAMGDQAAIERADWDVFRQTGIAHLMSISGLHVTMFAWLAAALVGRLWRCSGRAMLAVPAPTAARWGGVLLAWAYALLAGWGVPAQRTVLMLAVAAALGARGLRWPWLAVLLAAAVAVTLLDPWALLQPGFWLSFGAVALLVASEPATTARSSGGQTDPADQAGAERPPSWHQRVQAALLNALRTQAIATVGLAPLSLLFFGQLSLVGLVANLLAIPLVTLLITPLALLGVLLPPLWTLAAGLVQGLVAALGGLAGLPWALWNAAAAPPWAAVTGVLGAALMLLPLPWRLRWLGLPLCWPLLWPLPPRPLHGQFELVAADVGQGTAVLVRTARHLLVYDTGPATSPESDAGQRVLLPLLRHRGEPHIDLLVLSHRDTDHVGGAASLLAEMPTRALSSSLAQAHPLRQRGLPHTPCVAGQRWVWDGVAFEVLHPFTAEAPVGVKPNHLSCVLKVQAAQGSALLTGDVEAAQEAALVAAWPEALRSKLLLVPHHGSRTSSTAAFLQAVAPQAAVVQAAYRSRFGHPAPDVLARYHAQGVPVWRSDRCGALTWPAGQPLASAVCHRAVTARYWHHPDAAGGTHRP